MSSVCDVGDPADLHPGKHELDRLVRRSETSPTSVDGSFTRGEGVGSVQTDPSRLLY